VASKRIEDEIITKRLTLVVSGKSFSKVQGKRGVRWSGKKEVKKKQSF
jgi:hypothetical protein